VSYTLLTHLLLSRSPDLCLSNKAELHRFYRFCQVCHTVVMDLIDSHLHLIVLAAISTIVTILFSVLQFYSIFNIMLLVTLLGMSILEAIGLNKLSEFGARVADVSTKSMWSHRFWEGSKEDKIIFRSCPPLRLKVKSFLTFNKLTFPIIIQDIVIASIQNLRLIFRR